MDELMAMLTPCPVLASGTEDTLTIAPRTVFVAAEGHTFLAAGTGRPWQRRRGSLELMYALCAIKIFRNSVIQRYLPNSLSKINSKAHIYMRQRVLMHSK